MFAFLFSSYRFWEFPLTGSEGEFWFARGILLSWKDLQSQVAVVLGSLTAFYVCSFRMCPFAQGHGDPGLFPLWSVLSVVLLKLQLLSYSVCCCCNQSSQTCLEPHGVISQWSWRSLCGTVFASCDS